MTNSPVRTLSSVHPENRNMYTSPALTSNGDQDTLRNCVRRSLADYFANLDGETVNDLYEVVLAEMEIPLLEKVLQHTRGNQTKAAEMLGLNRGTLRKKLKQYGLL